MTGEEGLISQAKGGDLDSFNRLVESYQGQVYNLALRLLHSPQAAEDATQEAFISAYRAIRGFRGGNFRVWLLRIAVNACYDQLRASRCRPANSLDALLEESEIKLTSPIESPEDYALGRELGAALTGGLASLPHDQRLAVILCDIQGLSYEEMAQATGSSLGTVKSRLSRGRRGLRHYLQAHRELLPKRFRL